jgi:hypothetical protein
MEYYDISVQCTMISLGGNDTAEWAKREDVEVVLAERDRLAAENAELKKTVAETEQACIELSDELSHMHQLELEAKCHGDLEESHKIMVGMVAERDAELAELMVSSNRVAQNLMNELAAANATLDALREVVPEGTDRDRLIFAAYIADILYPRKSIK